MCSEARKPCVNERIDQTEHRKVTAYQKCSSRSFAPTCSAKANALDFGRLLFSSDGCAVAMQHMKASVQCRNRLGNRGIRRQSTFFLHLIRYPYPSSVHCLDNFFSPPFKIEKRYRADPVTVNHSGNWFIRGQSMGSFMFSFERG